jgi:hypothetical protein
VSSYGPLSSRKRFYGGSKTSSGRRHQRRGALLEHQTIWSAERELHREGGNF